MLNLPPCLEKQPLNVCRVKASEQKTLKLLHTCHSFQKSKALPFAHQRVKCRALAVSRDEDHTLLQMRKHTEAY